MLNILTIFMFIMYLMITFLIGLVINTNIPILNPLPLTIIEALLSFILITYTLQKTKILEEKYDDSITYNHYYLNIQPIKTYFIIYTLFTLLGIYLFTYIITYSKKTPLESLYTVTEINTKIYKYIHFPHIVLQNKSNKIIYTTEKINNYKLNQKLNLTINTGLFELKYVNHISSKGN